MLSWVHTRVLDYTLFLSHSVGKMSEADMKILNCLGGFLTRERWILANGKGVVGGARGTRFFFRLLVSWTTVRA